MCIENRWKKFHNNANVFEVKFNASWSGKLFKGQKTWTTKNLSDVDMEAKNKALCIVSFAFKYYILNWQIIKGTDNENAFGSNSIRKEREKG